MNAPRSVEKIGGTSISATDTVFDNVLIAGRSGAELYGRIFVVSAFAGLTDLLLENKKTGEPGVYGRFAADAREADEDRGWIEALETVRHEMKAINARMFARAASREQADAEVDGRIEAMRACLDDVDRLRAHGGFRLAETMATVREMLAGLGEAHSACATALLLRDRGVEAVAVDLPRWDDGEPPTLDERLEAELAPIDSSRCMPIVTGYVACKEAMLGRYGRGYTEMTFARLAALSGTGEAIIHKEFHLSSADPKLVGPGRARKIGRTNYDVADQLANLGMEAVHPRAGRELRQAGISLRVRNTFDRDDAGTLICGDYVSDQPRVEIITGLKSLYALQFFEQDMLGEKGFDAAILDTLARHQARIVSKSSNANTITHHLATSPAVLRRVIDDLESQFPRATISARAVAMVAAIGSDISAPGLVAHAMAALTEAGVTVIGLQHQIRNVDVQFLVDKANFDMAVRALHDALIASGPAAAAAREAA